MDKAYDSTPTKHARELRKEATKEERRLWGVINNRQIHGIRFNRQVPIGPFICDFVARSAKLVVELDGGQHGEAIIYDERRTKFLEERGYRVLRFWNHEVMKSLDDIVRVIGEALHQAPPAGAGGDGERSEPGEGLSINGDMPSPSRLRRSSPPAPAGGAKQ